MTWSSRWYRCYGAYFWFGTDQLCRTEREHGSDAGSYRSPVVSADFKLPDAAVQFSGFHPLAPDRCTWATDVRLIFDASANVLSAVPDATAITVRATSCCCTASLSDDLGARDADVTPAAPATNASAVATATGPPTGWPDRFQTLTILASAATIDSCSPSRNATDTFRSRYERHTDIFRRRP